MRLIRYLFAALTILPLVAHASPNPAVPEAVAALTRQYAELDMFSGTVLLAEGDKVLYSAAHGDANKDERIANQLNTKFNIGSIGKAFTAVAIMQLAEAGKLKLDDTLDQHLPEFPFAEKASISIQHLLNHSSGLGDYMGHPNYPKRMPRIRSVGDILPLIYDQAPQFAAGQAFAYSNSGMVVLGAVIERLSGLSYPDYLQQRIFEPAGMSESQLVQEDQPLANRSIGYMHRAQGGYMANVRAVMPASADGGLRTTVGDLLKFDQALRANTLLSAASQSLLYTPVGPDPHYASGWEARRIGEHRVLGHSGGAPGVSADFRRYLDDNYTLVVLANYGGVATELAQQIENLLFAQPYTMPSQSDADFARAQHLMMTGEGAVARKQFDRLGAAEPPHLRSLYMAARSRIVDKVELDQAISLLDRYITLADDSAQPRVSAAWWRKGNAHELRGEVSQAKASYEKALQLDPDDAEFKQSLKKLAAAAPVVED